MSKRKVKPTVDVRRWRAYALLAAFALGALVLEARVAYLQLVDREFLVAQGDNRHLRTVQIAAHRGPIVDRNGEVLAVSTPVDSIWAIPQEIKPALDRLPALAKALGMDQEFLARRITSNLDREFVYLKRHLRPSEAATVLELDMPGVRTLREYKRYYPAGEVAGHIIGFTDVDDLGQEGLEYALDYWLAGEPGSKRVLQDLLGRVVGDIEQISPSRPGRELRASIDLRLQYLAYRELLAAVSASGAQSGSITLLDVATGEVLAMATQPSFNPNDRTQLDAAHYRNRAVTDYLEPGSSIKPLIAAAAIESGQFTPESVIDTSPGYLEVGGRILTEDDSQYGAITLTEILAKSSSVGIAKVGLELEAEDIWRVLNGFGVGRVTESGFPGESAGVLNDYRHWRSIGQASISYGYGLGVTNLQLARAYAAVASGGLMPPVSFLALAAPPERDRVLTESTADALLGMLEVVVSTAGTGRQAAIPNYRVAGKTGTSRIAEAGRYSDDRYNAVFAGVAPAGNPRLVAVVVINDPRGADYYGGAVAAPVFSRVVGRALRILGVPPDDLPKDAALLMSQARVDP
jgi:cell division protein FtsI (penicillin-binding protein 3)